MWPLGKLRRLRFLFGGRGPIVVQCFAHTIESCPFLRKVFRYLEPFSTPLYCSFGVSHILTVAHNHEELTGCVYTWFEDKRWCRHIWSGPAALLRCCSGNILTSCLQPMVDPRKKLGKAHQLIVAMPSLVSSWFMLKEIGLNPTEPVFAFQYLWHSELTLFHLIRSRY